MQLIDCISTGGWDSFVEEVKQDCVFATKEDFIQALRKEFEEINELAERGEVILNKEKINSEYNKLAIDLYYYAKKISLMLQIYEGEL